MFASFRSDVRQIRFRDPNAPQRRGLDGKRLGRPRLLARHVRTRHRPVIDREDRLARVAVQHERQAHLRELDDRIALATAGPQGYQDGGRRQVVVPDVVAHDLVVPLALASGGIQRYDAVGEQVRALPERPVEIIRDGTGADEDPAAFLVNRDAAPRVAASERFPFRP